MKPADHGGLRAARFSDWDDDRLGECDPREFADLLHRRALDIAEDVYHAGNYEMAELDPAVYRERLTFYLRRRAWGECYFGTLTPARQITLLGADEAAMKLRLARQIKDEVRHHDVFAYEVKRLGGEWRIAHFPAPRTLLRMYEVQLARSSAAELAAANQYSGEIVLSVQDREEDNVLRMLLDERIMTALEDIEADEPAHIAIGRDLVRQYARTPGEMRAMAAAQELFLEAQIAQHVSEIQALGCRRVRAAPVFESRANDSPDSRDR
ncbi:hypothetical protein J4573_48225 [Actinomadura barringtoniae]|uniref:Ferritin-like domain-containing protein n=1 Tax=Actinomadura barringtoniae TaxID=1427535 RepID=A0A939PL44_9ACTN|nr:hypothetical protein [Actinomadura barringtoniae]MBO2454947.1 hypothetical protein [Actinomadura barringtoniae]